ncbi:MAG TPA: 16S rRNA (guanine(527)-N(7))-methyltransferase RsmG [Paracoccus sp. (in: a-proteobacteria)]|nr:16S rRNA (guanine(527)-N(7))-methyltransferase RsmG [Paracoccus sp. (in: a-proteobacteria)]
MTASREAEQLTAYAELIRKWNPAINLVSPNSLAELETRHIADSRQLACIASGAQGSWLDIGSGGGLPGIVVAIQRPDLSVTLLDSDARKIAFLRTAIRTLALGNCRAISGRIESSAPAHAQNLSARALAPLDRLMPYVQRHLAKDGTAWLMKGRNWQQEIASAQHGWDFHVTAHSSLTDPEAAILEIRELERHD